MKTRLEHEELLRDVLAEAADARAASLDHGLAALRRTRARRRAARLMLAGTPLLLLAALWIAPRLRDTPPPPPHQPSSPVAALAPVAKLIPGTPIRVINDEELLAVYQGRPVALLGEPGRQRLVLLDEVGH